MYKRGFTQVSHMFNTLCNTMKHKMNTQFLALKYPSKSPSILPPATLFGIDDSLGGGTCDPDDMSRVASKSRRKVGSRLSSSSSSLHRIDSISLPISTSLSDPSDIDSDSDESSTLSPCPSPPFQFEFLYLSVVSMSSTPSNTFLIRNKVHCEFIGIFLTIYFYTCS
jgi:hypothetical protein